VVLLNEPLLFLDNSGKLPTGAGTSAGVSGILLDNSGMFLENLGKVPTFASY
jgi:hypothetical protein